MQKVSDTLEFYVGKKKIFKFLHSGRKICIVYLNKWNDSIIQVSPLSFQAETLF